MRILSVLAALALGFAAASCAHVADGAATDARAPRFILVGDSTIAHGSGWGDAFCAELAAGAACVNMAKGGRSSKSYRAEGSWAEATTEMAKPFAGPTYVIVSFGHNDQPGKADRSSDFATEFSINMAGYVRDVRAAGAAPVLLTPVTRRQFRDGVLQDGLSAWSAAIRRVARETGTPLLDLAGDSVEAVQAMGPVRSMDMAPGTAPEDVIEAARSGTTIEAPKDRATPAPWLSDAERARLGNPAGVFDYTHLGPAGAQYFAAMVRAETERALPGLAGEFRAR